MSKHSTEKVKLISKKVQKGEQESWGVMVYVGKTENGIPIQPKKFFGLYTFTKPNGFIQTEHNKKVMKIVESLWIKEKEDHLRGEGFAFVDKEDNKDKFIDFGKWLDKYVNEYEKADIRVMRFVADAFKSFMKVRTKQTKIGTKDVTPIACIDFAEHLMNTHKGSGAQTYFQRFHKAVKRAKSEGLFVADPCADVRVKRDEKTLMKKLTLTEDEKQMFINCQPDSINKDVRCGFLFTLECGVAYCDLLKLTWGNISDGVVDGVECKVFSYNRSKTNEEGGSRVPSYLIEMMGNNGEQDELLFPNLPKTNEGGNKTLREWAKIIGIEKHLTWYCGRHTCATLDISSGKDPNGVAYKMGHKTTLQTLKTYSHKSKEAAVRMDIEPKQVIAPQQTTNDMQDMINKIISMEYLSAEQKLRMIADLNK